MPMSTLIRRRTRYVWYLATSDFYEDGEAAIDWREILPLDGTPAERSALLKSLKELVVALIEYPVTKGRARLAHSTVLLWCRQLRYLVRWMATQDIWSFDKLRPDHLLKFLMTRRERHGQGAPSDATWHAYILLYRRMWELRGKYSLPLSVNPGLIEADAKLLRGRAARPFKAVPEEVALPLINDAIEWLQRMGPFMARAAEELWQEKRLAAPLAPRVRTQRIRVVYERLCNTPEASELAGALCIQGPVHYRQLCQAMTITLGAAVTLLLFMVGLRVGELVRLDVDCLEEQESPTGLPITFIKGVAAKASGRKRRWVAGEPLPSVIAWLRSVFHLARTESNSVALFLTRSQGSMVPDPTTTARRLGGTMPIILMQAFAQAPFRAGRPVAVRLHPHAARKTFAKFVVKRDKKALEALSAHYGHAYREFTDGVYVGTDFELMQLLEEEDREDLARTLTNLLSSSRTAGKAAARIEEYRQAHRTDPAFAGKAGLRPLVESLVAKGIKMAPCSWGYCVYSESHSACQGDAIGPNEILRAPDVCATCANFVVTQEHHAWWNDRVRREEQFLVRKGLSVQATELVEKRLKDSKTILRGLVVERNSHPARTS